MTKNHLWKARGQGHVIFFSFYARNLRKAETRVAKFFVQVEYVKC